MCLAAACGHIDDVTPNTVIWVQARSGQGWKQLTTLPEFRSNVTVCQTKDGFLVVGGTIGGKACNHCHHFIAQSREWKRLADMVTARHGAAAVLLGDDVFVIGGAVGVGEEMEILSHCESIRLSSNTWSTHPPMRQGMLLPISVPINTTIYVLFNDHPYNKVNQVGGERSLQLLDTTTSRWSHGAPLPDDVGKTLGAGAVAINDTVLVAGGEDRICVQYLCHTNTWVSLKGPELIHFYGSLVVHNDKVLLLGGRWEANEGWEYHKECEEYDEDSDSWKASDSKLPVGLDGHQAVLLDIATGN